MTEQPSPTASPSFWKIVGRIAGVILRLFVVLLVGALIGVGLYFGVPRLYRSLVEPVERNTAELTSLRQRMERDQTQTAADIATAQDEITALEGRIAELEATVRNQQTDLASSQTMLSELDTRTEAAETSLAETAKDLTAVETSLKQVTGSLTEQGATLESQQAVIDNLLVDLEETLGQLKEQVAGVEGDVDPLKGKLALLQIAEDLLRIRILLQEDNIGDARNTLALALTHLQQLGSLSAAFTGPAADLETQLKALDELIASRSFRAMPSLDALWVGVMDLISVEPATLPLTTTAVTAPLTSTLALTATSVPTTTLVPTVVITTTEPLTSTTP